MTTIEQKIDSLKERHQAIILAHNYEPPEIQDIADITGDSLALSIEAARLQAPVIIFCGVRFMAESAAILAPQSRVILPRPESGCGLADMAEATALRKFKERHPGAVVITYVNSSAAVKAESDLCCTSGNAVNVVNSIPAERKIIFAPDRNLGAYVARQTGRQLILWEGFCPIHDALTTTEVASARKIHPTAQLLVHPECRPEIAELADAVLSTGGMFSHVAKSPEQEFIIATEEGMLYPLRRAYPDKIFYPVNHGKMICPDMKLISLDDIRNSLESLEPRITVASETAARAKQALTRMLDIPR
jgi:quinolinate synthase